VRITDSDATLMRTKHGATLGDHDASVVAGGKRRIILAALVTPAEGMEIVPTRDGLWWICVRRTLWPRQVTNGAWGHSYPAEGALD
jgi:hypothetical protein